MRTVLCLSPQRQKVMASGRVSHECAASASLASRPTTSPSLKINCELTPEFSRRHEPWVRPRSNDLPQVQLPPKLKRLV